MFGLSYDKALRALLSIAVLALPLAAVGQSFSGLYSQPLVGNTSAAPLFLMTMQRDARLFVEAYDDASDINGDGIMDVKYNPNLMEYDKAAGAYTTSRLDYYGYFDSYKCYEYDATTKRFNPIGDADANKKCSSYTKDASGLTRPWSGDFLNYVTTTRIDALRKVLYGGKRSTDDSPAKTAGNWNALTVLERANIPQDLHAFGKEYTGEAVDGYKISDFTPLPEPVSGKRHLFANVTLGKTADYDSRSAGADKGHPLLRILTDRTERVWDWVAAETTDVASATLKGNTVTPKDFRVYVRVCDSNQLPSRGADQHYCKTYGNGNKPTGILHDYGENNSVYFGLLTGSVKNNFSGGVLRRAIASFADEVDTSNGKFKDPSANVKGIVYALDKLMVRGFVGPGGSAYGGKTNSVGNPIAEMMYEGMRYLAGNTACTSAYCGGIARDASTGLSDEDPKLPILTTWTNPYGGSGFNLCAKPTQMVLSDVNPTKDSNELPGSPFATFAGSLGSLDVTKLADSIWGDMGYGSDKKIIIGEKYGNPADVGLPTIKSGISSFGYIRGLVPEDPGLEGSYYSASIAKFGKENDLQTLGNSAFSSSTITNRVVDTVAVALSSPQPRIEIPFEGKTITVLPFAKTYAGGWKTGDFVKSYVENVKNVSGAPTDASVNGGDPYYKLRIVFSDTSMYGDGGYDNDMDATAVYEVFLNKATKQITVNVCADPDPNNQKDASGAYFDPPTKCDRDGALSSGYSATGVTVMHMGYFISGVKIPEGEKAARLVVRNNGYGWGGTDVKHPELDYADARLDGTFTDNYYNTSTKSLADTAAYSVASADSKSLRLNHSKAYDILDASSGNFIEHDPLWYAAKYGGYSDSNGNKKLDGDEWRSSDGETPVGYYKVINAAKLRDQLEQAVAKKVLPPGSFAAAASNSTDMKTLGTLYQGKYVAKYWSGRLVAKSIDRTTGVVSDNDVWDASANLPAYDKRNIFTYRVEGPGGIEFKWTGSGALNTAEKAKLGSDENQLNYIRGARSNEGTTSPKFRVRDPGTVLGDIVNTAPRFAGGENLGYGALSGDAGASYNDFVNNTKKTRTEMVYVSANDGMLHGFKAADGVEQFAYIPRATLLGDNANQLSLLTSRSYAHKYFVDGPLVVDDFYDGSAWKSVLVGTLGAGGKSIFALDVTDPSKFGTSAVLWEFSHPELGYVRNPPIVARLNDGNWYVITGNGFESTTCKNSASPRYEMASASARLPLCNDPLPDAVRNAKLFLIKLNPDLSDGWTYGSDYFVIHATDEQTATTPPSVTAAADKSLTYSNGTDNGLSGPAVIGGKTNQTINYVYAGDLQGNVWKFDLSDADPNNWGVSYKVFRTKDASDLAQPITSSLAVGANPANTAESCISVGTGRFVYEGDLVYKALQSAYGIIDQGTTVAGRSDLQAYTITGKALEKFDANWWYAAYVSNDAFDTSKKGWYLDLKEPASFPVPREIGERIIQAPIQTKHRSGELEASFNTSIPTGDSCDASGIGMKLSFNACNGQGMTLPAFDLNGDGLFSNADMGNPPDGSRLAGVQIGRKDDTHSDALCFESEAGGVKGCVFDLAVLSCTDGRVISLKRPPSATNCSVSRTSWRQLR